MKLSSYVFAVGCSLIFAAPGYAGEASIDVSALSDSSWFQSETQKLYDALAVGDKAPWTEVLARDFIYTSEDGEVQNREQFLATVAPLPAGATGGIKIQELTVRSMDGGAVAHYLMNEWEKFHGQDLHTKYFATDTYRRDGTSWKLVASQVTVVPRDMEPVQVPTSTWNSLIGEYRVSPDAKSSYLVFVRDGKLYGGKSKESATYLIPLSPLVYFQSGSIHTMVFVADASGHVYEVREIHKYNEIVMARLSHASNM